MAELYPSDNELLNLIADEETGVEYIETGKAPYYLEFRKLLYRLLQATRRSNDLRVYAEGGLNVGVKAGVFWNGAAFSTYAGSTDNLLADDQDAIYLYLDGDGNLVTDTYDDWPGVEVVHIRLAVVTTSGGDITALNDARGHHQFVQPGALAVQARMVHAVAAGGITWGVPTVKVVDADTLKALLDGATNDLWAVKAGDVILKAELYVETEAGISSVLDLGLNAAANGGTADSEAIMVDADCNAAGYYSSDDTMHRGTLMDRGPRAVANDGYVTITSSLNISSSSFVGQAVLWYIPA